MSTTYTLKKKRERLIRRIADHMDFLIGSVSTKSLKTPAFNLTSTVNGVTKSRYIPKALLEDVRGLTKRHKTLKALIKELGDVNWKLVHRGEEL